MSRPKFFSRTHWLAFWASYILVQTLYVFTLAPSVTLEDSGELITAAAHFGVPHPPGYPTWSVVTWLFIKIFPFGNLAWRANLCSSLFGALSCGVVALVTSYLAEKLCDADRLRKRLSPEIPIGYLVFAAGMIAGLSLGFVESLWFQSVITEVYALNAFFFALILLFMLRWLYEPDRLIWGFLTFLAYGVGLTNHQTLTLFAPALLVFIGFANWRLLRDLLPYVLMAGCTVALGTMSKVAILVSLVLYIVFVVMMIRTSRDSLDAPRIVFLAVSFLLPVIVGYFAAECFNDRTSVAALPNLIPVRWAIFLLGWLVLLQLVLTFSGRVEAVLPCLLTIGVAGAMAPRNPHVQYTIAATVAIAAVMIWMMWRSGGLSPLRIARMTASLLLPVAGGYLVALGLAEGREFPAAEFRNAFAPAQVSDLQLMVTAGILLLVVLSAQVGLGWMGGHSSWNGRRSLVLILGGLIGVSTYAYLPLASGTNPPMNWAYASTVRGFIHSVTRGQYDAIKEKRTAKDFFKQIEFYYTNLVENYTLPVGLLALLALVGIFEYGLTEKKYAVTLLLGWMCLSLLLTWLVNTTFEEQTLFINRVFYATSHMIYSIWLGLGLVMLFALVGQIRVIQSWLLALVLLGVLSFLAAGFESAFLIYPVTIAGIFSFIVFLWIGTRPGPEIRKTIKTHFKWIVAAIGLAGLVFYFASWTVGWAPAIAAWAGLLLLAAVLYVWRSKPGKSNPFGLSACASVMVIPVIILLNNWYPMGNRSWTSAENGHEYGWRYGYDMLKNLDRNAIVFGGTDPGRFVPTFMIFVESFAQPSERYHKGRDFDRRDLYIITQNALADTTYMDYIRDHYTTRRPKNYNGFERWLGRDKMYPEKPIIIPDQDRYDDIFNRVCAELQNQPGSGVVRYMDESGMLRLGAEGIEAIFAINGGVARDIFEANKDSHSFYVEESYPLEWMYPYLEPYGLIMKLNKEPLDAIPPEAIKKDFEFWNKYVADLLTDPRFLEDVVARRAFAKLRSSIGGLYSKRGLKPEAEVALLQAIALFPGSPEGASRLIELYVRQERFDEAAIIGLSWLNNDPDNRTAGELMRHVSILAQMAANRVPLTLKFRSDPGDATVYLELAATLAQMQRYEELDEVVRQYLGNKEPDSKALERTVNLFNNFQQNERLIRLLQTELKRRPASYHLWYNLGVSQALHRDTTNALTSLERAVRLNPNLKQYAAQDPRLENLHGMPEFHGLTRDGARSNSQPPAPRP